MDEPAEPRFMFVHPRKWNNRPLIIAAALQKINGLMDKIPLQNRSYATDHLFIVPTLQAEETYVFPFSLYPPVKSRIQRVLHNS